MCRTIPTLAFGALALAACSRHSAKEEFEFHCLGERVVEAQAPVVAERIYRFISESSALEEWNAESKSFERWGTGRLSVTPSEVSYKGELRGADSRIVVRRQLRLNRSSGKVHDQLEASWGSTMAFGRSSRPSR
jgi:hypothetical protein